MIVQLLYCVDFAKHQNWSIQQKSVWKSGCATDIALFTYQQYNYNLNHYTNLVSSNNFYNTLHNLRKYNINNAMIHVTHIV